jgi:DNA-binding transcriptional MerR regulator
VSSKAYRIGEVAALTGVTVEALRYYEREGLLPTPLRSANGARRFGPDQVSRVRFVKQAQAVGLTLRDIQQLVGLQRGHSRAACTRMRKVLAERLSEIEGRVSELQLFRTMLQEHLQACDAALESGAEPECPARGALERTR